MFEALFILLFLGMIFSVSFWVVVLLIKLEYPYKTIREILKEI